MPLPALAVPLIMGGLGALGGLFGNRKQTQQQTGSEQNISTQDIDTTDYQQGFQSTTGNVSNLPQYDPMQLAIRDYLLGQFGKNLKQSQNLQQGYLSQGLRQINEGAGLKEQAVQNVLASRGLTYSPMAANAQAAIQTQRIGDQINFANQVPLIQQQLTADNLNSFANFFRSLPVGNVQTTNLTTDTGGYNRRVGHNVTQGQRETQGTVTNPGNMLGGLFTGGAAGVLAGFNVADALRRR